MPTSYTIKPGDYLGKVASAHGFSRWQDIYYSPYNAAFRVKRPDPNKIFPGDVIVIPDKLGPASTSKPGGLPVPKFGGAKDVTPTMSPGVVPSEPDPAVDPKVSIMPTITIRLPRFGHIYPLEVPLTEVSGGGALNSFAPVAPTSGAPMPKSAPSPDTAWGNWAIVDVDGEPGLACYPHPVVTDFIGRDQGKMGNIVGKILPVSGKATWHFKFPVLPLGHYKFKFQMKVEKEFSAEQTVVFLIGAGVINTHGGGV
jgi:hypothetical protein